MFPIAQSTATFIPLYVFTDYAAYEHNKNFI